MLRLRGLLVIALALTACSSQEYLGLQDRGMLPLSGTDAFLGSNVFLAQEMQRDSYLYNFVRGRGGPNAIEIDDTGSKTRMMMYYTKERAMYIAEPFKEDGSQRWIIRGPYQIAWKDVKRLRDLSRGYQPSAIFFIAGRYQRFPEEAATPPQRLVQVYVPATPKPTPVRRKKPPAPVITAEAQKETGTQQLDPKEYQKMNLDQRALLIAQGYAPRDANGDILHVVKGSESLGQIAKWYTNAEKNVDQIASANGLAAGASLQPGAKIRIPLALIQNMKAMPAEAH